MFKILLFKLQLPEPFSSARISKLTHLQAKQTCSLTKEMEDIGDKCLALTLLFLFPTEDVK